MPSSADAQLLFGLIALQNGLIDQSKLVAAFQAWTLDRSKSLADHLVAMGHLDDGRRSAVEALASFHVETHGDAEKSLASITVGRSTRELLASIADPDLDATLSQVAPSETDADRTATYQVGSAASEGLRFRVLRPHAKGGLGAVFVALDSELNREVALKQILENHADDPVSRGRFLVEAEITGGLEHPGIVPVYGLGTYNDGRPYYAMRFIRGDSLREAIETFHKGPKSGPGRSLEFRQLLKRFTDVCNAIEYAHARGVLHRDIKPGNVIVGKHGETLVVDWGLAKALGQSRADAAERTLIPTSGDGSSETLPGQALGTPAYMSPEQARGDIEKLGPRSDVYSLGATLHCLLTGKAPFSGHPAAVLKAVELGDFPRPRAVGPSIDPALEAIALKAMAKEPADRYATARELAEDIDRWLADERVEAYPEPWTRGLNRWLSRHRTGVTGAVAAGLVALIGLGIVSAVQTRAREDLDAKNRELTKANAEEAKARRDLDAKNGELTRANTDLAASNTALDRQRERAEANEAEAIDAVKRFRDAVVGNPELRKNPALESLRKALLKEPLAFFGGLRERLEAGGDTRPESMERLAKVAFDHARLVDETGNKQDAIQGYRHTHDILERLSRAHPGVDDYQEGLATSLNNMGSLLLESGRAGEAMEAKERALGIRDRLAQSQPDHPKYQADLADSHFSMGLQLTQTGRLDDGLKSFEKAREILGRLVEKYPDIARYQADLVAILNRLGNLHGLAGRYDETLAAFERARDVGDRLVRGHADAPKYRAALASSHFSVGNALRALKRIDEALESYERAREIQARLAEEEPDVTKHRDALSASLNNIGNLLAARGRVGEADNAFKESIAIVERLARDNPNLPDYACDLGIAWNNLAVLDLKASRFAEARARLADAIAWQKKALAANPKHPQYRLALELQLNNVIRAEKGLGREDEAARVGRELAEFHLNDPIFEPIDARLKAVINGEAAKDNAERLQLAQRAHDTRHFDAAARLWGEALDADPKLAESRSPQHRYNAACDAALSANGQGIDPPAGEEEKARLRGRALDWLRAEREAWAKILESGQPQAREAAAGDLRHWQGDSDLAGIRDLDSLAKLPETERRDWEKLWEDVRDLLERASKP